MGLYSEGSYEDVLSQLTDGLSWASGCQESYPAPPKSAIFQARARLGPKPLAALFARVAKPIGTPGMSGVWLAGRRLVAIDGSCPDVADTPVNAAFFGRPGVMNSVCGLSWSATTGPHVGHESLLERDRLWVADFDPRVIRIVPAVAVVLP